MPPYINFVRANVHNLFPVIKEVFKKPTAADVCAVNAPVDISSGIVLIDGSFDAQPNPPRKLVLTLVDANVPAHGYVTVESQPQVITSATGTIKVASVPHADRSATGTIKVLSPPHVLTAATGTLKVVTNPAAEEQIVVGTKTYTFVESNPGAGQILIGGDEAGTATNIVAKVLSDLAAIPLSAVQVDGSHDTWVDMTAVAGSAGNGLTLTGDGAKITKVDFSGGLDADQLSVGTKTYTFVVSGAGATQINVGSTSVTATNIAARLTTDKAAVPLLSAAVDGSQPTWVDMVALIGSDGNSTTLTVDGSRLTKVVFSGGEDTDTLVVGTKTYTFTPDTPGAGQIQVAGDAAGVATNIADQLVTDENDIPLDIAAVDGSHDTWVDMTANPGADGNDLTLTVDGVRITKVAFSGGLDADTITVGAVTYTFLDVPPPMNTGIQVGGTKAETATNIADALMACVYFIPLLNAHPDSVDIETVQMLAIPGSDGNDLTLTVDGVRLTKSDFSGGLDAQGTITGSLTLLGKSLFGKDITEVIAVDTSTTYTHVSKHAYAKITSVMGELDGTAEGNVLSIGVVNELQLMYKVERNGDILREEYNGVTVALSSSRRIDTYANTYSVQSILDGDKDLVVYYKRRT